MISWSLNDSSIIQLEDPSLNFCLLNWNVYTRQGGGLSRLGLEFGSWATYFKKLGLGLDSPMIFQDFLVES